jgi:hypothetical protein
MDTSAPSFQIDDVGFRIARSIRSRWASNRRRGRRTFMQ